MTPPHSKDAQRQRFESWARRETSLSLVTVVSANGGSEYYHPETVDCFLTWQSAELPAEGLRECLRKLAKKWRKLAADNDTKGEHAFYVAVAQRSCASEIERLLKEGE